MNSNSHIPISEATEGSTEVSVGVILRKMPLSLLALTANPKGLTNNITLYNPTGNKLIWQTASV